MKTTRVLLHDRENKKPSSFHKICTWEHPIPHFGSEKLHGYDFSHIRLPIEQFEFHKREVKPTHISLPTPPASPEFWGTSLQKWYQKKPLFTLTAKGQVKRLEKYLQIQKTLEMCKREHDFVVYNDHMKQAYLDFEFREHQPLLYEDKDYCCICPCNSSRRHDIDFIPADYIACRPAKPKFCVCTDDEASKNVPKSATKPKLYRDNLFVRKYIYPGEEGEEEKIIARTIIKEGEMDPDDKGIFKIVVKQKEQPENQDSKNVRMDENIYYMTDNVNAFSEMPKNKVKSSRSGVSRITLDNIASLPFDYKNIYQRNSRSSNSYKNPCPSCQSYQFTDLSSSNEYEDKYDINENYILDVDSSEINK
ncbi:uncharacterized protein LOC123677521 [Harmonia axyridis]|uniref:uncharacterized protein LOC123677521 n=1 Tax=Harmonia axyridis TaxID=115357 RepID=UPI001E276099|nr:uncharacterized protein LOC123677521 [Harmonia axyridis]